MPGAGTHIFIANEILSRLNSAQCTNDGTFKIELEPINGSGQKLPVILKNELVAILARNPDSFRAGAISPDFFPDVFFGITLSHQPYLQQKTLVDYIANFTKSVDFGNEKQVAYMFGWLTHLCADVFGHHWVGMETKGDFETWVETATTNPDVIRKHIGIEMLWDKTLPASPKDLAFERSLIQSAMLTEGMPLCDQYYNYKDYQPLHAIIKTIHLGRWHGEQAQKITQFRDRLRENDPSTIDFLKRLCPLCRGTEKIREEIRGCPLCRGTGKIREEIRGCPLCRGTGKIADPFCGGSKKVSQKVRIPFTHLYRTITVTCPVCLGIGEIPCPHDAGEVVLDVIEKTCPHDAGEVVLDVIEKTCPICTFGAAIQPLRLICDRLITYHQHRQKHTQRIVDSYLNAHEQVADCILNDKLGDILKCYEPFWDEVQTFVITQGSFIEFVTPELQTLEEQMVKLVEAALENFKEMVIPDFIEEIKDAIVKTMAEKVAKLFNLTLTEPEENYYRNIFNQYEPQAFPPLANAIQLYLLSLNQVSPTASGLQQAVSILGSVNNIDKRCQPFLTKPFKDSLENEFPWTQYFYDFLDGNSSFDYCEQQGIKVRNTTSNDVLVVDQENNPAAWGGGAVNITPANQVSQTFIPSRPCLLAVDVGLKTGNPGRGGDQVTLKIFDSNKKLLAPTSALIPEGFDGFWHFNLPSNGVTVTPGQPITLRLEDTGKTVFFWKYQGNNPYPSGQAFFYGSPFGTYDFLFKTYGC
jgi:Zinc dependent phospholipase C